MKLNNKGFAITAVLYGLLILFVVLVSSYLLVLSAKKDRVDTLVNEIENSYNSEGIKYQILLIDEEGNSSLGNPTYIVKNGTATIKLDAISYNLLSVEGAEYATTSEIEYDEQTGEVIEKWIIINLSEPTSNVKIYYEKV